VNIAVVYLKGGTGKTATAGLLGLALDSEPAEPERPRRRCYRGLVGLVDADPQASLFDWSKADGWPLPTIHWPTRDLARRVKQIQGNHPHLVIDTPPGDVDIARQAVIASDLVIVPIGPDAGEIRQLSSTQQLLDEIETYRPISRRILLTRVDRRIQETALARRVLEDPPPVGLGLPLFATEIHRRRQYARAYGAVPVELGEYLDVAIELEGAHVNQA
jgi:chromosome partitioning protein